MCALIQPVPQNVALTPKEFGFRKIVVRLARLSRKENRGGSQLFKVNESGWGIQLFEMRGFPKLHRAYRVEDAAMTINYGLNKVRFPAPVPVGSTVRADVALAEVAEVAGGVQLVLHATMLIDGGTKPGCVADWITRVYF